MALGNDLLLDLLVLGDLAEKLATTGVDNIDDLLWMPLLAKL